MLKNLDNDVFFFNNEIVFVIAGFHNVRLFNDDVGLVNVDLNNASLDDDSFDGDDPENIIHVTLIICCNRYKQCKPCQNEESKKLMPVT